MCAHTHTLPRSKTGKAPSRATIPGPRLQLLAQYVRQPNFYCPTAGRFDRQLLSSRQTLRLTMPLRSPTVSAVTEVPPAALWDPPMAPSSLTPNGRAITARQRFGGFSHPTVSHSRPSPSIRPCPIWTVTRQDRLWPDVALSWPDVAQSWPDLAREHWRQRPCRQSRSFSTAPAHTHKLA